MSIETYKRSWLHKLHTHYAKNCLKCSKGCNSVKINSSSIKTPDAYFHYVHNKCARFQKDPLKTVGAVDYKKLYTAERDERTDIRTDSGKS